MHEALISVIVPVYKVEKYLDECVQSIVNQTYKNLEIILVDDGSPDRCPEMCDEWARRDSRIKVIHKENGGASAARNAGLDIAVGQYVGFVDSDDYIATNMYEVLRNALIRQEKGIACCSMYTVTEKGEHLRKESSPAQKNLNIESALDAIFTLQADTSFCSKLYARKVLEKLRFPEGETNEEFSLLIPSVIFAQGLIHTQENLYYYRQRVGSVTKQAMPREADAFVLSNNLRKIEEQLKKYDIKKTKSFGFFSAQFSFWRAISYEKHYKQLSATLKEAYGIYRKIMAKNCAAYLLSTHSTMQNKLLYILVLTRLLRPIYKILNKPL